MQGQPGIEDMRAALGVLRAMPLTAHLVPRIRDLAPRLVQLGFCEWRDMPDGRRLVLTEAGRVAAH